MKTCIFIFSIVFATILFAQPNEECIQKISKSQFRYQPTAVEQKCFVDKVGSMAFDILCPQGRILPKFDTYLQFEELKREIPEGAYGRIDQIYIDWKKLGFYNDDEINRGLNTIPMEATLDCMSSNESHKNKSINDTSRNAIKKADEQSSTITPSANAISK